VEPGGPSGELKASSHADPGSPRGYVVAWRLAGRRVVVVGGGEVAEQKVTGLLDAGAELILVAPEVVPRLACLADAGTLTWMRRAVRDDDVVGAALVVAATGDPAVNAQVATAARRAGALVNAVDDPANCDVTIPAVVRRGPATVAVTTDGVSPGAARFLRERLDAWLPSQLAAMVTEAGAARAELRRTGRYRYDYDVWRRRFFAPAMDALAAGAGPDAIHDLARRFVADFDDEPE
jgi:siroheme synthase-like protein